ncbi:MAG: response regulator, partial [Bacteroidota bacterium]|nr:response regulator [Bacteroidota bacterium]
MNSNNIMIVEDERIVAADLQLTLEEFGYSVVGVESSGEGAVTKADKLKPDLILMDIMLKGEMNGIQAAFNIGNNHDIPVIFITAYADNSTIRHALDANPFGYILKPFKKKELRASIELALSKKMAALYPAKEFPERVNEEREDKTVNNKIMKHSAQIMLADPSEANSISIANIPSNTFFFRTGNSQQTPLSKYKAPMLQTKLPDQKPAPFSDLLAKHNTDLCTLVNELKNETISQRGLNLLIKVSYKLAVFKVKKNINKIFNLNKRWDLSVEDIAVEGISGLFVKNSKRNMLNIRYSLINWEERVFDNMEALFFMNKAVGLSVEQCINKLIRDSDPSFARVLDTINYAIKRYNYSKVDYFGVWYIVHNSTGQITGSTIDYDEFNNIPLDINMNKKEMLSYLCCYISDCTGCFPAIPLNPLIERILGYSQNTTAEMEFSTPSDFGRLSIDNIIQ